MFTFASATLAPGENSHLVQGLWACRHSAQPIANRRLLAFFVFPKSDVTQQHVLFGIYVFALWCLVLWSPCNAMQVSSGCALSPMPPPSPHTQ